MKIKLKLLGMLTVISSFTNAGETEVDFLGNSVRDLVNHLLSKIEFEEKRLLLDEQGEILSELLVFCNGEFIPAPNQLSHLLAEEDLVELAVTSG